MLTSASSTKMKLATLCVLAFLFVGCSSAPNTPDEAPDVTQTSIDPEVRQFVMTEGTGVIAKLDLDAWPRLYPMVLKAWQKSPRGAQESAEEKQKAANETAPPTLREFVGRVSGHEDVLPNLDVHRTSWLSFETRLLDEAQGCVDIGGLCSYFHYTAPRFGRLLVAAHDSEKLADELREVLPSYFPRQGPLSYRFVPMNDYVRVEFALGSDRSRAQAHLSERSATMPAGPERRMTPALERFLSHDGLGALYMPTGELLQLTRTQGLIEIVEALETATPTNRLLMWLKGVQFALEDTSPNSLESVEFEDASIIVDGDDRGGLIVDAHATPTPHGRRVAEAASLDISLPELGIKAPAIEIEWAVDRTAVVDTFGPPNLYDYSSPVRSPMAFLSTVRQSGRIELPRVAAGRIAVAEIDSPEEGAPPVRAAAIFVTEHNADLPAHITQFEEQVGQNPLMDIETRRREDGRTELRVAFNAQPEEVFGEATPVETLMVHLDKAVTEGEKGEALAKWMRKASRFGVLDYDIYEHLRGQFEMMTLTGNGASLAVRSGPVQFAVRYHIGDGEAGGPALSQTEIELIQPTNNCTQDARNVLMEAFEDDSPASIYAGLTEVQEEFDDRTKACAESSPELAGRMAMAHIHFRWMRGMLARHLGKREEAEQIFSLSRQLSNPTLGAPYLADSHFTPPIPSTGVQFVDNLEPTTNAAHRANTVQLIAKAPESEGYPEESLRAFVREHQHQIAWCVQDRLATHSELEGSLTLHLSLYKHDGEAHVGRAYVDEKQMRPLQGCLSRALAGEQLSDTADAFDNARAKLVFEIVAPAETQKPKNAADESEATEDEPTEDKASEKVDI